LKPTIENLADPRKAFQWTLFHLALGAATTVVPLLFILYFHIVLITNFPSTSNEARKGNMTPFILYMSYLLSFELLARITASAPFVPHEYAKYIMIALCVYFIAISPRKSQKTGLWLLALLLPGLLYDHSGLRAWEDIVNCVLGPMGLALGVTLFGSYTPTPLLIKKSLRLMWLPMVAIVVNMYLKTPELEDLTFQLKASYATTGGASSNQASTILGLGMFLSFYSLYTGQAFAGRRILDGAMLMVFAYQGLLTFSRGGMIVGFLAIFLLVLTTDPSQTASIGNKRGKSSAKNRASILYIMLGAAFLYVSYLIVDNATGGKLSLRYKGETNSTISGNAEKDFSKVTSGRSDIVEGDLSIWADYPIFGGGGGSSGHLRSIRNQEGFLAPHIELTRLLAEHGMLGLINFILIMFIGWKSWVNRNRVHSGNILFILFLIGFLTSFHSSTRTAVTPFMISISAMSLMAGSPRRLK
jgi:hypothetical protein